jgi:DNA-directed RNA polymerase subunit beta
MVEENGLVRYGKIATLIPPPPLTKIHPRAFERFLQDGVPPERRKSVGLEAILRETFPIKSYDGSVSLEYLSYEIAQPRYSPGECRTLGITYAAPFKLRLRLNSPRGSIEEDVYLGDIPLMLGGGYFIVNGTERCIVNQLHRAPGIDFSETRVGDKRVHTCTIVPERGSWLELAVTKRESLAVKIDQGSKIPASTFLRAISPQTSTNEEILRTFYEVEAVKISPTTNEDDLVNRVTVRSLTDPKTNETLVEAGRRLQRGILPILQEKEIRQADLLQRMEDPLILNTILEEDDTSSHEEALTYIYKRLRPGAPISIDKAKQVVLERFFDANRYRLGRVGRFRINRKLGTDIPEADVTLRPEDIVEAIKYVMRLRRGEGHIDDIDHLGNRRVRTIDELFSDELRKGFFRLKRAITERLSGELKENASPKTIIHSKIISSAIDYFFTRSELSQVIDQTNPIAAMTHQRRLSALGPGGLNRKRAGFEVRDVHISHYGRICPIETPEGTNIGLITSLATYADVDEYGFIVTPYRVVKNGAVTDEIVLLRADEESRKIIAPPDVDIDPKSGKIQGDKIMARVYGELLYAEPGKVELMDAAPSQMVSISTALIPFLEHDDANRALMGSNMQRQAVPLVRTEPPVVGTGFERIVAENSDMVVAADREGVVTHVDAARIVVREADETERVYRLRKFEGLNEKTCLNQRPVVKVGDRVRAGQLIGDGPCTYQGELALGRNLVVAFLPWEGYNFEDAIIVSERVVREDLFTSIHVEEFEAVTRETRMGKEEFSRDIPNISEQILNKLDEHGVIQVGSYVHPGDILVGKVTPTGRTELTPEEKLLNAIFGFAGQDVKNESLRVPPGVEGIVIDARRFSRTIAMSVADKKKVKLDVLKIETEIYGGIQSSIEKAMEELREILGRPPVRAFDYGPTGQVRTLNDLKARLNVREMGIKGKKQFDDAEIVVRNLLARVEAMENERDKRVNLITHGTELPAGIHEMVKVYVAIKRNLSVGDKMAGRHGNKGVIAKVCPQEEMPFLEDGTPVDIVLNPLGVPSRMNVGQILETHIGWAAQKLGLRIVTPPFDGATEEEIEEMLEKAGLPRDGKVALFDGRSGEPFDEKVTVGVIYMMKLHHLVDDKIHARSTGPYSLITQQPLGGRARAGGQRFGEMEVWALEAYGAAHTLQEILTVKSDDVFGRNRIYDSIVRGLNILEPSTPASFEVLINELKGLALNIKLEKTKEPTL